MAPIQSLANAFPEQTFGGLCGKFSTLVTSHFSDKCTRVDVLFDRHPPNSIKRGKGVLPQRRFEQGHQEECGEQR